MLPYGISNSRKAHSMMLLILLGTFGVFGGLIGAIVVIGGAVVGSLVAGRDIIRSSFSLMIFNSSSMDEMCACIFAICSKQGLHGPSREEVRLLGNWAVNEI